MRLTPLNSTIAIITPVYCFRPRITKDRGGENNYFFLLSFCTYLHAEHAPQQPQSPPQELLPFFFLIIAAIATPNTTATQPIIRTISNGFISILLFLIYALSGKDFCFFACALFQYITANTTTAITAAQMKSVHHQAPMVYTIEATIYEVASQNRSVM